MSVMPGFLLLTSKQHELKRTNQTTEHNPVQPIKMLKLSEKQKKERNYYVFMLGLCLASKKKINTYMLRTKQKSSKNKIEDR